MLNKFTSSYFYCDLKSFNTSITIFKSKKLMFGILITLLWEVRLKLYARFWNIEYHLVIESFPK